MSSPPPVQLEVEVVDESMEDDPGEMIPPDRFTLPTRADEVLALWRSKMESGELGISHFQDHWRVTVPRIYSPQPNRTCLDWSFDEELGQKLLIQPLEEFIWGSKDGDQVMKPRRSTLCGRVFKQGEPAYSCRECGMDNTCVLCVECFKVSAHREHKYKMGQSGGGGCCDCGDTEAWKRDPFCQLHKGPKDESGQGDFSIDEDVVKRMKVVADVVLSYCFRLLTMDHSPGLPNDLKLKDGERDPLQILDQPDCYCTVLYNDETHTFEQVITALTRVMKCNQRDSVELVSLIDREGRALVKCNSFQLCDKLKSDIELFTSRHGPSLKVMVMHAHLIAHQIFAMKLLNWMQTFVSSEPALRLAVSLVGLGVGDPAPLDRTAVTGATGAGGVVGGVLQNDCRMWKAARTAWHRLLIATTLMDYDTKKTMAILFTRNYGSMLKDFIRDDHDHSFSVSSLSVQLYTTPSIAHLLIRQHDALYLVLNTFLSECTRRCNARGRLEFDRNHVSMGFKRAQFVLYDVKYLLSSVPTTFDDELRKGFLHGLSLLLNLLVMMQGMDSVVRQVGQHMEYEPEWESAFNLHVKLAHSITLTLEWCAADRTLLASAYRMTLKRLVDTETFEPTELKELGAVSASVIPYCVSREPVSVHRPLSRLLAGLHLALAHHDLHHHHPDLARQPAPTPAQLIEPILRTWTMIAQVHAGMWRRNGFALLNQLYFYHNVKCRAEMLDRDVVMLQIGASLMESNEFIIHVMNKFNLLEWANPEFEQKPIEDDTLRHTISMVEELLALLITVVGSRYVPGVGEVTPEDRTKKEIIQMLCVKPMPHSELNKCLPEDQLHETGLEAVIHEVADFVKPTGAAHRGMYTLKPPLYDHYDTFYYHYTREELSRSEDAQRERRKAAGLPECCPPPVLPLLAPPFKLIASLLQSDAALHVLKTVLERTLDLRARSYSEAQVHKALHLMGYAVRDEMSGQYEFVAFSERAARAGIVELLEKLVVSPRVDAHRPLAVWLLNHLKSLLGGEGGSGDSEAMETDKQEKPPVEEPVDPEKARRAKLAAERRSKLMAQMQAAQKQFISNNSVLFEATTTEETRGHSEGEVGRPLDTGVATGVWGGGVSDSHRVCIMCQEEARVEDVDQPLVLVAYVQKSTVLSVRRGDVDGEVAGGGRRREEAAPPTLPLSLPAAPHVSSCGHALHAHCCTKYVDGVADKEKRRPYRLRQPAAFDVERREFLCPLCERLCNSALPLLPAPPAPLSLPPPLSLTLLQDSLQLILKHQVTSEAVHHCTESCEEMHCTARARSVGAMSSDMDTGDESGEESPVLVSTHSRELLSAEFLAHFDPTPSLLSESINTLVHDFTKVIPLVCGEPETGKMASLAALYRSISYTVMSVECVLRAENRPLLGELPARHRDALQALVRIGAVSSLVWTEPRQPAHLALSALHQLQHASPLAHHAFSTLVALVLSAPGLFGRARGPARPTLLARFLTQHSLTAHVARAVLTLDLKNFVLTDGESKSPRPDLEPLLELVIRARPQFAEASLCIESIWADVQQQCKAFLRCCCLFFHFLSDVAPPAELGEPNGDTWETLCGYVGINGSCRELITSAGPLVLRWTGAPVAEWMREPAEPPRLVSLPDDFSDLMNVVSEFCCPNLEREDSKNPTMCLVCGQLLCSQSYCCQTEINRWWRCGASGGSGGSGSETVGAVVGHCAGCGGGAGVFLRVRDCETLLLAAPARGALLPAPYLDSYGETDQGLRRGNPLRLCPEKYEQLRMLWLSHGLHERIARALDTNVLVNVQWQNL